METLKFNKSNVESIKSIIETNRSVMNDAFEKYNNQKQLSEENFQGMTANASHESFDELVSNYNLFLEKIQNYIDALDNSLTTLTDTDNSGVGSYQN